MGLTATARSVAGTLRQDISVGGHQLVTDQPVGAGGQGIGPTPHDLLPAALAGCVAWAVVQYGTTKHWELGDVVVVVDYDRNSVPRRVDLTVEFGAELTADQLKRLKRVVAACPVRHSLEAGFEFVEHLHSRRHAA